jgi:hypothetical protein
MNCGSAGKGTIPSLSLGPLGKQGCGWGPGLKSWLAAVALPSFQVSDLRNQVYPEDGLGPFPGEGRVVGQQSMFKASDRVEEYPGKLYPKAEPGGGGCAGQVPGGLYHHSQALPGPRFPMPFLQAPA